MKIDLDVLIGGLAMLALVVGVVALMLGSYYVGRGRRCDRCPAKKTNVPHWKAKLGAP